MSDNKRRLTYLSDIDGLRAIAVPTVVYPILRYGPDVGVDFFFVVSEFLITLVQSSNAGGQLPTFQFSCQTNKAGACKCAGCGSLKLSKHRGLD